MASNEQEFMQYGRGIVFFGLILGIVIGYSIPTVDIEARNRFAESCRHVLNIVHFAVLGATLGFILDVWRNGWPKLFPEKSTFRSLVVTMAVSAELIITVMNYLYLLREMS